MILLSPTVKFETGVPPRRFFRTCPGSTCSIVMDASLFGGTKENGDHFSSIFRANPNLSIEDAISSADTRKRKWSTSPAPLESVASWL
ncbi:hypothetical protein TNCV_4431811 [Trichonephila clavipes]|nr:hypothetical protein TNCV_4431811 [Trichonephila clavipes]